MSRAVLGLMALAVAGHAAVVLAQAPAAAIADADPLVSAYVDAKAGLQPLQNAVYLYLRLAGVVWITVEWVAAVVLVRTYFLVRRKFRTSGDA